MTNKNDDFLRETKNVKMNSKSKVNLSFDQMNKIKSKFANNLLETEKVYDFVN